MWERKVLILIDSEVKPWKNLSWAPPLQSAGRGFPAPPNPQLTGEVFVSSPPLSKSLPFQFFHADEVFIGVCAGRFCIRADFLHEVRW